MNTYLMKAQTGSVDTKENWEADCFTEESDNLIEVVRVGDDWLQTDEIEDLEIDISEIEACISLDEVRELLSNYTLELVETFFHLNMVEDRVMLAATYAYYSTDIDQFKDVETWEQQEIMLFNALEESLSPFDFIDSDWKCEAISIATQMCQVAIYQESLC